MDINIIEEDLNDINTLNTGIAIVHFFDDRKTKAQELLLRWNYKECAELAEKTLEEYEIFKLKNIEVTSELCQLALHSFEAGFKLLMLLAKIKEKQVALSEIDLLALKKLVIESYKFKEFPSLFCMVVGRFSQVFLEHKYFGLAKVFSILSTDAFGHMEINGTRFNYFRSLGINASIKPNEACHFRLNDELQYLIRMFDHSVDVKLRPLQESPEKDSKDCMLDDILDNMELVSLNNFPKLVQTNLEAQQLFDVIFPKLKDLQLCLSKQDIPENDLMYPIIVEISTLFNKYWHGLVFHYLAFFEDDSTKKFTLVYTSMEYWEALKEQHFTQKHLKMYHLKHPNENAISIYCNLLDKSITNFGYLISIRSQSLLVFAAPSAVLESLNNERKRAISLMKEKMTYMELCGKKCSETERIITYYQVASQLRSIVSIDKETQREFMKDSEIYIRLYVNALAKDYKSFLMIHGGDRPNDALIRDWKNLNRKSKEDFVRRSIQKIDEDPFIKKFRI